MDDDYDIYGDLEGFEIETRKENQIVKELNAEIEELKAKIVEKESEKEEITKQNGILLENISSLLLTAKAEIKRKDSLISDIRRQRDDNAFRRQPRAVRKCDKGTQTTLIRLLNQAAQTESVGTMTETKTVEARGRDRDRRRSQSQSRENRKASEHSRHRERIPYSDLRNKLRERNTSRRPALNNIRRDRRATRVHERERERDQRARHRENRTPDLSPVEFPCLLRKPTKEVSNADSIAETKLKEAFIPMNGRELDRYVKEMVRSDPDRQSPDVAPLETVSNSDLWDVQNEKKSSKKNEREGKVTKEEHIIQSDEIGTTGVGTSLSPEKIEDVEQKMRALHGESTPSVNLTPECTQTSIELLNGLSKSCDPMDTSQPPALVIPPPEPSIIELVPELSFEDDQRLNDSRELRIVESEDTAAELDERCSSVETVIDVQQRASQDEEVDLEEGELVSSDESQPAHGNVGRSQPAIPERLKATTSVPEIKRKPKPERTPRRRDGKARILLDKLSDSVIRKHSRSGRHHQTRDDNKSSRREKKRDSSKHRDRPPVEHFETSTPNRTQTTLRKSQRLSDARDEQTKENPKPKLSDPIQVTREDPIDDEVAHPGKSRKESLKELFGTDDENSLFGTPEKMSGKRRHSEARDKSDDRKKQKVGVEGTDDREERVFKEVGGTEESKSKGLAKSRVSSDECPVKVTSNSKLNEPILVDSSSEDVPEIFVQHDQPVHENNHQPSKPEENAKTLLVNDTIPKRKDRVRSNSSSKNTNIKDEHARSQKDASKRLSETAKTESQPKQDVLLNVSNKSASEPQTCGDQPSPQCQPTREVSSSRKRRNSGKRVVLSNNSVTKTDVIESNTTETQPVSDKPTDLSKESFKSDQAAEDSLQNLPRNEVQTSTSPLLSKNPTKIEKGPTIQEPLPNATLQQSDRESETPTEGTAKEAEASEGDLPNKPIQQDVREPKEQQVPDIPPPEVCSIPQPDSAEPPTPADESPCQPKEPELASEPNLPETPKAAAPDCENSESQLRKTPQVVVYSNKYGEYRVEDNSETEITIYVTRRKRKSRKSNHASPNVSGAGLDVK